MRLDQSAGFRFPVATVDYGFQSPVALGLTVHKPEQHPAFQSSSLFGFQYVSLQSAASSNHESYSGLSQGMTPISSRLVYHCQSCLYCLIEIMMRILFDPLSLSFLEASCCSAFVSLFLKAVVISELR